MAISADSHWIAFGSQEKTVQLFYWEREMTVKESYKHLDQVVSLAFSIDSKYIASACDARTIKVWDIVANKLLIEISTEINIKSLAFSSSSRWIASGSYQGKIIIWRVASEGLIEEKTIKIKEDNQITTLVFSIDQKYLAFASNDNIITNYEIAEDLLKTYKGHTDIITTLAFSPDDQYIASGSNDGTVRVWNRASANCEGMLPFSFPVGHVSFSKNENGYIELMVGAYCVFYYILQNARQKIFSYRTFFATTRYSGISATVGAIGPSCEAGTHKKLKEKKGHPQIIFIIFFIQIIFIIILILNNVMLMWATKNSFWLFIILVVIFYAGLCYAYGGNENKSYRK